MSATPDPPVIPNYTFVRYIDSGGFADVYLFRQEGVGREVALKVLRARDLAQTSVQTFQAEARRMAALAHRNVVTIHDFGVAPDGRPYISMEYCPDHMGRISRRTTIGVERAIRVAIQIAGAVDTAHGVGIVHRDIKPANILVRGNGDPVLTDFGIAGTRSAGADEIVGFSIPYAPPEVIRGTTPGEVRADVYSLGATVYTLLAGRSPFEIRNGDNSERGLVQRVLTEAAPPTGRADVPSSLEGLLRRALEKSPEARFRTAAEFARSLQKVEAEFAYHATPFEGAETARSGAQPDELTDVERTRAAPRSDVSSSDDDRTRTRLVTTVSPDDAKRADRIASPVDRGPDVERGTVEEGRWSKVAWPPLLLGGLALVAVAVVIVQGARTGDTGNGGEPSPTATVEFEFGDPPPIPADVVVQRSDGDVVVEWDPVEPEPGDTYVVQVVEGPRSGPATTTLESTFRIEDVGPDDQVCVVVSADRGGVRSDDSAPSCVQTADAPTGSGT